MQARPSHVLLLTRPISHTLKLSYCVFLRAQKAYGGDSIYLHDPAALVVCLRPELFSWRRGAVRVATEGVARGHTIMDAGLKNWVGHNPWLERPQVRPERASLPRSVA